MHLDRKQLRNIFLLAAGAIAFAWVLLDTERVGLMFHTIWSLISPFALGAVIAFVFNVPMRAIERQLTGVKKPGIRRCLAILLTLAAMVVVILFVVELLIPQIQITISRLSVTVPAFAERIAGSLRRLMEDHPELMAWVLETFKLESLDWSAIVMNVLSFASTQASNMMGSAVTVIGSVTSGIVDTAMGIAFSFYCLGRKEILARQGRRLLYSLLPERLCDEVVRVLRLTNATFSNFISGQCLEACILGCLFAIAMSLFRMPYVPLVSVVIAVTALIPVVGAFVGCIVGAFFILVENPLLAVTFVIMFLVIQQLENNLIYPRVVGTSIGLPGMWVLVAVTIGGDMMGVIGMLLMIPLTSVIYTLLREFTNARLAQRNIPTEKLQDHPPELQMERVRENRRKQERIRLEKIREKRQKNQQNRKK